MKYLVILIIFTSCTIGTEYHGSGEGDECGIRLACADGLKCVNHICVREITDAGSDIIDADITDITDASDGDVFDAADADGSVQCDPDTTPCGDECCTEQQLCLDNTCIDTQGNCTGDEQCSGDTWCHEGLCIPYGTGRAVDGNGAGIRGRRFDYGANPMSDEISVNTTYLNHQKMPTVVKVGDLYFIAWQDESASEPDDSGTSIRMRVLRQDVFTSGK
ncbi:hypothetical protein KKF34_17755 [Myxococcota bacterium]|nr:hypothetical protein [Myxococcota bacterium]MBU1382181.1 hypothetical protein [Myxococcota bacterium]MBU1498729.1 hypothetical protein [Myxococcota bacterium]